MRLEAEIKMGYYPTPLSVVERIRTFIRFPDDNVNLLDPCCGDGSGLKNLKGDAKATTYGIELDQNRANKAKKNLDHVLKGSYEEARISHNAFSCLYLNPPYDWGARSEGQPGERKEKTFRIEDVFLQFLWHGPGGHDEHFEAAHVVAAPYLC